MEIHFKNGTIKVITQDVAEILKKNIINGCQYFQIFTDENNIVILFIKLSEVVFID